MGIISYSSSLLQQQQKKHKIGTQEILIAGWIT